MPDPLILTLRLDVSAFAVFDALRQQRFPADRNFLPAHVTLFHSLPGERLPDVRDVLETVCAAEPSIPLALRTMRFFGRGVAVEVAATGLLDRRKRLRSLMMNKGHGAVNQALLGLAESHNDPPVKSTLED